MENNNDVRQLVKSIRTGITQVSASQKDETRVMQAMLNDRAYVVGVYSGNQQTGEYCPAVDARNMIASVISSAAHIPTAEAQALAQNHEFKRREAESMVGISKEFINTYLQTDRKLPLGGREQSNVALSLRQVEPGVRRFPVQVGVNPDGSPRCESSGETFVPGYQSIKVHAPCPQWLKNQGK